MQWESMGFKAEPFKTKPITSLTLDLYTGNKAKIAECEFALQSDNHVMVVEGARGVGTTSFANYLRFTAEIKKYYFTPIAEIRVEPTWNADTLMAAIISNVVSTLELHHLEEVKKVAKFIEAKAVVKKITETYRSFGASVFGIGANYGESGSTSQPMVMPTQMLAEHLKSLVEIIFKLGYKYGLLIQLNNLDVGTVQNEAHLKIVLNVMRDYFQTSGTSWLLVGDENLRRFIAQNVDRLDDIIAHEIAITALSEKEYLELIDCRIKYFRINSKVTLPVDKEVLLYLYKITDGRLRYVFGLLTRLLNALQLGTLTDRVTIELAKPIIKAFAKQRLDRFKLSTNEELVLRAVVENKNAQVKQLTTIVGKKDSYISTILAQLQGYKLVSYRKEWRSHYYYPSIEANIVYSKDD